MEERGIDVECLSEITNVSPVTVIRWLNGNFEPRQKNFIRISEALDVSNDYLLGRA